MVLNKYIFSSGVNSVTKNYSSLLFQDITEPFAKLKYTFATHFLKHLRLQ